MINQQDELIQSKDRKLLNKLFFRSLTVFAPFNYAKQGGSGFCYSLLPFIEEYYPKDSEERRQALIRSTGWYNITQNIGTFVMALIASMEKENAQKPDFDEESINAVKASLMGPLSGIGDTLFWGVLRVIAAGIAIPFAADGNFLAPLIFLLVYNIPSLLTRWHLTNLGFSVGVKYIDELYNSGLMETLTKAASILGLMMLGGMTRTLVHFNASLEFSFGADQTLVIQEVLDDIFIGLIPLCFTLLCYYLLAKKKMNFSVLIIAVIILGIGCSFLGIA